VGQLIGALFCSVAACLLALGTAVDSDGALFFRCTCIASGASSIVAAAPDILRPCMLTGGERYGTGLTNVSEMLLALLEFQRWGNVSMRVFLSIVIRHCRQLTDLKRNTNPSEYLMGSGTCFVHSRFSNPPLTWSSKTIEPDNARKIRHLSCLQQVQFRTFTYYRTSGRMD
jgi:hypothetical protein